MLVHFLLSLIYDPFGLDTLCSIGCLRHVRSSTHIGCTSCPLSSVAPPSFWLHPPVVLVAPPVVLVAPPVVLVAPPVVLAAPPVVLVAPPSCLLLTPLHALPFCAPLAVGCDVAPFHHHRRCDLMYTLHRRYSGPILYLYLLSHSHFGRNATRSIYTT
jgi:hypothetical protein